MSSFALPMGRTRLWGRQMELEAFASRAEQRTADVGKLMKLKAPASVLGLYIPVSLRRAVGRTSRSCAVW